ncbi:maleylpyruvate isomerase N-terminal domain-containing protein [Streptomyces sp. 769]|uniref:maleylpyruvate isomerase N-terminal domain-containing protein n=1 Tax=Streptomyces sp. 769 TaxID=1262452 RepID=UPI0031B6205F
MASMSYDRHCAEIVAQSALLRTRLDGADLSAPVPTCPGWTLAQLVRHLGGAHRWAETIIRTRAADPVPDDLVDDVSGHPDVDAATLGAWLTDGAEQLADALRAAGPDAPVWTVAPGGTPAFWARRMTHETVVHRADATFVAAQAPGGPAGADRPFAVVEDVAVDALDGGCPSAPCRWCGRPRPGSPTSWAGATPSASRPPTPPPRPRRTG